MKKHFNLFIGLAALLAMSSCRREGQSYTITGRVLQECNGQPYANKPLSLRQGIGGLNSTSSGEVGTATTDANGNFSVAYVPDNTRELEIQVPASFGYATIVDNIPAGKDVKDLLLYIQPTTTVRVTLNVSKSYTTNDTLYFTDLRNLTDFGRKAGPFQSGILYTAPDLGFINQHYGQSLYGTPFRYKMGVNSMWTTQYINVSPCDTSRAIININ